MNNTTPAGEMVSLIKENDFFYLRNDFNCRPEEYVNFFEKYFGNPR